MSSHVARPQCLHTSESAQYIHTMRSLSLVILAVLMVLAVSTSMARSLVEDISEQQLETLERSADTARATPWPQHVHHWLEMKLRI